MGFLPAKLIQKKRDGEEHSREEIEFLVSTCTTGELPDYQMAAWLMAVYFKGMSDREIADYTRAMKHSGRVFDFSHLNSPRVDKHSTGGVGDKTSLIIGPILAACEVYVPMIAGRGLGHTGGTLDKLESIPGFRVGLSFEEFCEHVKEHYFSLMGQTADICPSDKKIYALRDVTATVASLPLICGSIMSKKLAEDLTGLVLDVKYGSGAFMKTLDDGERLARLLQATGEKNGVAVTALVTNMNQPLGRFIGNALEVKECLDIMKSSNDYPDTRELSLQLSAHMLVLANKADSPQEGYKLAEAQIISGAALEAFEKFCKYQGPANLAALPEAKHKKDVLSPTSGYLQKINTEEVGLAALELGAGRRITTDTIDFTAGIEVHHRIGDKIAKAQTLFTLYGNSPESFAVSEKILLKSLSFSAEAVEPEKLIGTILNATI